MKLAVIRRMFTLAGIFIILFSVVSSTAVAGTIDLFSSEKGDIKISGGTAHIPVMKDAAKQIMEHNRDIRISIAGGGSGVGIKQVGEGLVDIGNSGRKP
ncbi:MAG: substrate-binding domain-containing protein, partial [Desulfobacterales bacterium]|nr:substrate-binding domain-containing protein [Desulfobacterales bacterium]